MLRGSTHFSSLGAAGGRRSGDDVNSVVVLVVLLHDDDAEVACVILSRITRYCRVLLYLQTSLRIARTDMATPDASVCCHIMPAPASFKHVAGCCRLSRGEPTGCKQQHVATAALVLVLFAVALLLIYRIVRGLRILPVVISVELFAGSCPATSLLTRLDSHGAIRLHTAVMNDVELKPRMSPSDVDTVHIKAPLRDAINDIVRSVGAAVKDVLLEGRAHSRLYLLVFGE